jgi:hypothetical protein
VGRKAGSSRRASPHSLSAVDAHQERTNALLAQILIHVMGESSQRKKALALRNAGFTNAAIAGFMGTSPEVIGQVLYLARRERSKRGRRP